MESQKEFIESVIRSKILIRKDISNHLDIPLIHKKYINLADSKNIKYKSNSYKIGNDYHFVTKFLFKTEDEIRSYLKDIENIQL